MSDTNASTDDDGIVDMNYDIDAPASDKPREIDRERAIVWFDLVGPDWYIQFKFKNLQRIKSKLGEDYFNKFQAGLQNMYPDIFELALSEGAKNDKMPNKTLSLDFFEEKATFDEIMPYLLDALFLKMFRKPWLEHLTDRATELQKAAEEGERRKRAAEAGDPSPESLKS